MSKLHIGRKIKEVVKRSGLRVSVFAEKINLTRDGAYKIFAKESIDTEQLKNISSVLNHDFFSYYNTTSLSSAKESSKDYGFASQHDVNELKQIVKDLAKEVSKLREEIVPNLPAGKAGKKAVAKTYSRAKKK